MKKIIALLLCLFAMLPIAGTISCAESANTEAASEPLSVDLDLSSFSGTMVYAQVYNIMCKPESWLGKIIRMAGKYSYYNDAETGTVYHACLVQDATACCAQGFEFIWQGEHNWPKDYPDTGTDIIVTGRLETYEENGQQYLHLVDSEVTWEKSRKSIFPGF